MDTDLDRLKLTIGRSLQDVRTVLALRFSVFLLPILFSPVWSFEATLRSGQSVPVPREYFGLHIHRAAGGTPWPPVQFGSWRLWDSGVAWPQLEPERGRWDFRPQDRYVELAAEHKVDILLTLGLTPAWASARPTEPSAYNAGNAAEPRSLTDWEDYVKTVAARYKGRIHSYEIWNEPNVRGTFSSSPEVMANLANIGYRVLKSVDPSINVVSPSPTPTAGIAWLGRSLKSGGCPISDVIGYHFYVTPARPEAMLSLIENVRRTLRIYRCTDKPIWNTESGWALPKAFPSEEEAAAYLMRTLIINWLMGIDRIYWYAWDNHNWSTLATTTSDTQGVTPARLAYNIAEGWLDGSMLDSCTEHGDLWVCVLRKGSSVMHIIWAAGRRVSYSIPPTWAVKTIYDWRGHVCQLQESLTVTEVPLELLSQSILPQ